MTSSSIVKHVEARNKNGMNNDDPNPDNIDDETERIEASLTVTEFFWSLEKCDSKRVIDFWAELPDTVLEIVNLNGTDK